MKKTENVEKVVERINRVLEALSDVNNVAVPNARDKLTAHVCILSHDTKQALQRELREARDLLDAL